jgi:hypothetical protein
VGGGHNSFSLLPGLVNTPPIYNLSFCPSFSLGLSNSLFSFFVGGLYLSLSLTIGFLNPAS